MRQAEKNISKLKDKAKKYWIIITGILLIGGYSVGTYLLWNKFRVDISELKDVITIQIQSTALFIGLVASTIGLYNFWRKSGVKLLITMDSNILRHIVSIRNLKDKEIIVFNLYLCLIINKKTYMLDVLSSSINSEKEIVLKAYGHQDLEMRFPVAIKIETRYELKNLGEYKIPKEEYIYLRPLVKSGPLGFFNNIILHKMRNQNKIKYIAHTSAGAFISKTKKRTPMFIKNKLTFYDRNKIAIDYCDFYKERIFPLTEDDLSKLKPENINDSTLDNFLRQHETTVSDLRVNEKNMNNCVNLYDKYEPFHPSQTLPSMNNGQFDSWF